MSTPLLPPYPLVGSLDHPYIAMNHAMMEQAFTECRGDQDDDSNGSASLYATGRQKEVEHRAY